MDITNISSSVRPYILEKLVEFILKQPSEERAGILEVVESIDVVDSPDMTEYLTPDYLLSLSDNIEELQELCNKYNHTNDENIRLHREVKSYKIKLDKLCELLSNMENKIEEQKKAYLEQVLLLSKVRAKIEAMNIR
jgi:DNA repair ATPase RecN